MIGKKIITAYDLSGGDTDGEAGEASSGQEKAGMQVVWSGLTGTLDAVVTFEQTLDGTNWLSTGQTTTLNAATGNVILTYFEYIGNNARANVVVNGVTGGTLDVYFVNKN